MPTPKPAPKILKRLFDGRSPNIFLRGFDRPNITLNFTVKDSPPQANLDLCQRPARTIGHCVLCDPWRAPRRLPKDWREAGHNARAYHGGMEADTRRAVEELFQREDDLIVVATVAFGMGNRQARYSLGRPCRSAQVN